MFSKSMNTARRWSTETLVGGGAGETFIEALGAAGTTTAAAVTAGTVSATGATPTPLCRRAPPLRRRGFLSASAVSAAGNGTVSSIIFSFLARSRRRRS